MIQFSPSTFMANSPVLPWPSMSISDIGLFFD
jgi:hypothetical protein